MYRCFLSYFAVLKDFMPAEREAALTERISYGNCPETANVT